MARKGWIKENLDNYDGYSDYPGVGKVFDSQIVGFVVKHLRITDYFNPRKIALAGIYAQLMLFGVVEMPEDPDFKW